MGGNWLLISQIGKLVGHWVAQLDEANKISNILYTSSKTRLDCILSHPLQLLYISEQE